MRRSHQLSTQPSDAEGWYFRSRLPRRAVTTPHKRSVCELSADQLVVLSALGDPGARTELLIREIMLIDGLTWSSAAEQVDVMAAALPETEESGVAGCAWPHALP